MTAKYTQTYDCSFLSWRGFCITISLPMAIQRAVRDGQLPLLIVLHNYSEWFCALAKRADKSEVLSLETKRYKNAIANQRPFPSVLDFGMYL